MEKVDTLGLHNITHGAETCILFGSLQPRCESSGVRSSDGVPCNPLLICPSPAVTVRVKWRPYFLNPNAPPVGTLWPAFPVFDVVHNR